MIIKKVLNNNVVLAENHSAKEIVMMGKGLAFQKKAGELIDESLVEKKFVMETDDSLEKMKRMVLCREDLVEYLEVVRKIVEYANQTLKVKFNDQIYVLLSDYIRFAIARHKSRSDLKCTPLWREAPFYQKEYQVGLKALDIIQEKLGYTLTKNEAEFIALYIMNARQDDQENSTTLKSIKIVQDILKIITYEYNGVLQDQLSFEYTRFVSYIQFSLKGCCLVK